jgi:predicted nucleic acid-binding protein
MPVVDASVVVDWVAPRADPHGPAGRLLADLVEQGAPVLAPQLLLEEVANALLTGIRRERWSGPEADDAFDLLSRLPVELVSTREDFSRAWDLARRYDQNPFYEMVYVATAERLQQPLVTADRTLVMRLRGVACVRALG